MEESTPSFNAQEQPAQVKKTDYKNAFLIAVFLLVFVSSSFAMHLYLTKDSAGCNDNALGDSVIKTLTKDKSATSADPSNIPAALPQTGNLMNIAEDTKNSILGKKDNYVLAARKLEPALNTGDGSAFSLNYQMLSNTIDGFLANPYSDSRQVVLDKIAAAKTMAKDSYGRSASKTAASEKDMAALLSAITDLTAEVSALG